MTEGYEVFGNALDRSVLASLRELQDDGDPDIVYQVYKYLTIIDKI